MMTQIWQTDDFGQKKVSRKGPKHFLKIRNSWKYAVSVMFCALDLLHDAPVRCLLINADVVNLVSG